MRCTRPIRRRRIISTNIKTIADPSRQAYAASATAMDDQIGRVLQALEQKKMLDNTLVVFQSDNGGTRDPLFAGAITDMSKVVLPADNGPAAMSRAPFTRGALAWSPSRAGRARSRKVLP